MKQRFMVLILGVLMVFGAYQVGQRRVHAETQTSTPTTIPSSFGHCAGYVHVKGSDGLIFEASDGTIRLLNLDTGGIITFTRN